MKKNPKIEEKTHKEYLFLLNKRKPLNILTSNSEKYLQLN